MQNYNWMNYYKIKAKCVAIKVNGEICGRDNLNGTKACSFRRHHEVFNNLPEATKNERYEILLQKRLEEQAEIEEELRGEEILAGIVPAAPLFLRHNQKTIKFSVLQSQQSCPICLIEYESNTDIFLGKCGHTMCGPCFTALPKRSCPLCRSNI